MNRFILYLVMAGRIALGVIGGITLLLVAGVVLLFISILMEPAAEAATPKVTACSWDKPGHRPFTGNVPAAVNRYTDIPAPVRAKLRARMERRQYDEIALITRDTIEGKEGFYNGLRDMHFGAGKVCNTVSRAKWSDQHKERGLVYCEGEHCIIVPTVCRNVSRVTRVVPLVYEPPAAGVTLPPIYATPEVPPGGDFSGPVAPPVVITEVPRETFGGPTGWTPWPWPPTFVTYIPERPFVPGGPSTPPPGGPGTPPLFPPGTVPPGEPPVTPPTQPPVTPPGTDPPVTPPVVPPVLPPTPPVSPPVPEPAAALLVLLGAAMVGLYTSRRGARVDVSQDPDRGMW